MVTKLTIEYDGTGFAGWARQPGKRTVQEEIERALQTILREPLTLTVAGRTDRGVHAWEQVASYEQEAVDHRRLNGLLADDLAILAAEPAPVGFDARRDATSRTYCYRVLTRSARSVFERGHAFWWTQELDREALAECAKALLGRHDFTAFTPTETEHTRFLRDVSRAEWREGPLRLGGSSGAGARWPDGGEEQPSPGREPAALLEFWIEADTFMRHMNRVLVGTMLEVASGGRTVEDFRRLLEGGPRAQAGKTAPAHGLALAGVSYM